MTRRFIPSAHGIVRRRAPRKIAVLSIDVEHDYTGHRTDALDRLPDLLDLLRRARLPVTAFVEGRLFAERPDLCAHLAEAGADLQLHCYDHRGPGDTTESLGRGIDAFERFVGARPRGYRAHTYRLTEALFQALVAEGFAWDSSILPGIGLGNHPDEAFRDGDWFVLDDALAEFPVASWRRLGIPFTQSYRRLMGRFAEALLARADSLPDLLVYDMHMVDLVRDGRIGRSPLPLWLKGAYALSRRGPPGLDDLAALAERLCAEGYEWSTLSCCYERLAGRGRAARPPAGPPPCPEEAGGDGLDRSASAPRRPPRRGDPGGPRAPA